MTEQWVHFFVVIFFQLIFFIVHAWYEKRIHDIPRILALSMVIGVLLGIPFDLLVGKFLSFYDYELGFGLFFLTVNGALSWGFMQANALLMEKDRFLHFYVWTILVGIVYETTNYYFRVWNWDFASLPVEVVCVHAFGYAGVATMMACVWHFVFRRHFAFITDRLG